MHLKKKINRINRNNIYINEPLPEIEASIAILATKRGVVFSTHLSTVSARCERHKQTKVYERQRAGGS